MNTKKMVLCLVGAAALALPAAASAQPYGQPYEQQYGRGYDQPSDQPGYYGGGGDYEGRRRFSGYPEFRGFEQHISQEIQQSVRDDMIAPDDARDLMGQLRQIRYQEMREFRVHGWRLPDDDRQRIRAQLARLDHLVDETRDEQ